MCAAGSPVIILGLLPDQISQIIRDRMRRFALTVSMDQRRDALCLHLSFQAEDLALAQVQGNGGTGSGHKTLENLLHDIYLPRFAAVQENVSSSLHGDDIITVPLWGDIIIVPRHAAAGLLSTDSENVTPKVRKRDSENVTPLNGIFG